MDATLDFLKRVIADDDIGDNIVDICEKIDRIRREDASVTVSLDEKETILSFPSSYDELSAKRAEFDALLNAGAPLHVTRLGGGVLMIDVFIHDGRKDDDEL